MSRHCGVSVVPGKIGYNEKLIPNCKIGEILDKNSDIPKCIPRPKFVPGNEDLDFPNLYPKILPPTS